MTAENIPGVSQGNAGDCASDSFLYLEGYIVGQHGQGRRPGNDSPVLRLHHTEYKIRGNLIELQRLCFGVKQLPGLNSRNGFGGIFQRTVI